MAASWPPTSGATRTSVAAPPPTPGPAGSGRHSRYPPATTAMTRAPSATMPARLRLAIHLPPLAEKRGHHREREINDRQGQESAPIVCHLPQARTELVDADETVDREIRREYVSRRQHRLGDRLARPGKTGQEQLRQARTEENECRRLWMPEPGARCL